MKKALPILAVLTLVVFLLFGYKPVLATQENQTGQKTGEVEKVDSFEMFWPIVAGRTVGDPIYVLKATKESLREMLIFSKYRKTDYNITLSVKRAVELEKLIQNKDYDNASKTAENAKRVRSKVNSNLKALSDEGVNTTDLKTTFKNSLTNQKKLFVYLLSKSTDDKSKEIINSFISSVDSDISLIK